LGNRAGELVRTYKFEDFRAAMRFVNQVPIWRKRPDTIRTSTSATTRSAWPWSPTMPEGLTNKDFDLAALADKAV
jgi:pterin-4a-carbinolamine dehydratase